MFTIAVKKAVKNIVEDKTSGYSQDLVFDIQNCFVCWLILFVNLLTG